jgi:hypothetical protein
VFDEAKHENVKAWWLSPRNTGYTKDNLPQERRPIGKDIGVSPYTIDKKQTALQKFRPSVDLFQNFS